MSIRTKSVVLKFSISSVRINDCTGKAEGADKKSINNDWLNRQSVRGRADVNKWQTLHFGPSKLKATCSNETLPHEQPQGDQVVEALSGHRRKWQP